MIKSLLFILFTFIAIPISKPPWKVLNAGPATVMRLYKDANKLPKCAQMAVDKRLRFVLFRRETPGPDNGFKDATSFKNGLMLMSFLPGATLDTAFIHELGHYYDWEYHVSLTKEWRDALALDFSEMSPELRREEDYIHDPAEAFAELFSAKFMGDRYYVGDHYHVGLFQHTSQLLETSLCKDDDNAGAAKKDPYPALKDDLVFNVK